MKLLALLPFILMFSSYGIAEQSPIEEVQPPSAQSAVADDAADSPQSGNQSDGNQDDAATSPAESTETAEQAEPKELGKLAPSLAQEFYQLKPEKQAAEKSGSADYGEMVVGLLVVLGLIVVLAWSAKRFNLNGMTTNQSLRLQSVLSLGTKEKVVIGNVEGRRVLLGVTPESINLLMELEHGEQPNLTSLTGTTSQQLSFAQQIKKAITQGKLGEDSNAS